MLCWAKSGSLWNLTRRWVSGVLSQVKREADVPQVSRRRSSRQGEHDETRANSRGVKLTRRSALMMGAAAAVSTSGVASAQASPPDHRRARRPGFDRSALHRHRHACRGAEAHLRHAGVVGRPAAARAVPRRELEPDRPDDLGVQAAPRRQIPRRQRLHRRGRQVLDRAHGDLVGPQPDDDLRAPRGARDHRRSPHDPCHDRGAVADPGERLHPRVHRLAPRGRRPERGQGGERRLQRRRPRSARDPSSSCRGRRASSSCSSASTNTGAARPPGSGWSAARCVNDPARVAQIRAGQLDIIQRAPPADVPTFEQRARGQVVAAIRSTSSTSSSTCAKRSADQREDGPRCRPTRCATAGARGDQPRRSTGRPWSTWRWRASAASRTRWSRRRSSATTASCQLREDLPRARQLMAQAGYPNGFKIMFNFTNDRLPGDRAVGTAVAQMLARIASTSRRTARRARCSSPRAPGATCRW